MSRHPFDLLMELPTEDIRLDCAALHLARDAHPDFDLVGCLRQLDELAEEVAAMRPGVAAVTRYTALREVLVERHEFRGNQEDYYDADNSYLNRVLERRVGIPISLSVIWVEVGRRLKWPVSGVAFPGHFLVRIDDRDHMVVVDPFREAASLSQEDLTELLRQQSDGGIEFRPELLNPVDCRAILSRMLGNLRSIYMVHRDLNRLERVLRRLVAVEPRNPRHFQELASLKYQQGDLRAAYLCLSEFLARSREKRGQESVRRTLRRLAERIASMN